jgi:O-antigen/teichoic acid export membrane protein
MNRLSGGTEDRRPHPPLDAQIARGSVFSVAARGAYVVGWLFLAPFMLTTLGPERFGLWSLITVVSGLYVTLDLGLSSALTRFVAEFRAANDAVSLRRVFTLGTIIYAVLSLAIVVTVVLMQDLIIHALRIAPELVPEARTAIVVAVIGYGVLNMYMLMASVLSGLQRMDLWNQVSIGVTILQLGGVWLVLWLGGGVVALVLNTSVSVLAGAVACRLLIRRLAPEIRLARSPLDSRLLKRLLRYGGALQVINLGVLVQFQLDKVLFGTFLSLAAVTSYEFGYRVMAALWAIPALMLPPLLPAVAHIDSEGDRERIVRLYRRASRYVLAVAFPIASGVIALSPVLFFAWLGPGHGDAARVATALAGMLAVNILTGVGTAVARGIEKPGMEVRYQVAAMVLHLGLSLLLIPRFGFAGGLWAMFLSTSVASLYFVWRFQRFIGDPLGAFGWSILARPGISALAAGAVAWWVGGAASPDLESWSRAEALIRLLAGATALVIVASASMLVTRYVSTREIRDLAGLLQGRLGGSARAT